MLGPPQSRGALSQVGWNLTLHPPLSVVGCAATMSTMMTRPTYDRQNKISLLPAQIVSMSSLRTLSLSSNALTALPCSLSDMHRYIISFHVAVEVLPTLACTLCDHICIVWVKHTWIAIASQSWMTRYVDCQHSRCSRTSCCEVYWKAPTVVMHSCHCRYWYCPITW